MDKPPEKKAHKRVYIFRSNPIRMPPGTKSRAKLPRGLGPDAPPGWSRWSVAGLVLTALVLGTIIGRFILP